MNVQKIQQRCQFFELMFNILGVRNIFQNSDESQYIIYKLACISFKMNIITPSAVMKNERHIYPYNCLRQRRMSISLRAVVKIRSPLSCKSLQPPVFFVMVSGCIHFHARSSIKTTGFLRVDDSLPDSLLQKARVTTTGNTPIPKPVHRGAKT